MAKYYPHLCVKCNNCGKEELIPLEYEDDRDRWTRAWGEGRPMVWFPPNWNGWHLEAGNEGIDYCPACAETCVAKNVEAETPEPTG